MEGQELPRLDGTRAVDGKPAGWTDFFPDGYGIILRLHAKCEACVPLAKRLGSIDLKHLVVLVEGSGGEKHKFLRGTGLDPRVVVFISETGDTIARLGLTWTPAALAVRGGRRGKAAQVHDVNVLKAFIDKEVVNYRDENGLRDRSVRLG